MPVSIEHETAFPDYRRAWTTTDDDPVVTVLVDVPNEGDAALIPSIHVIGRIEDGFYGNLQLGGYSVVNVRGTATLQSSNEASPVVGAGGLTATITTEGTEVHLTIVGSDRDTILWGACWRVFDFPADE